MKPLLLLIPILFLFACDDTSETESANTEKELMITGQILNPIDDSVRFVIMPSVMSATTRRAENYVIQKAALDRNGHFRYALKLPESPAQIYFRHSPEYGMELLVNNGENLVLTANTKFWDTGTQFGGTAAAASRNHFWQEHKLATRDSLGGQPERNMDPATYLEYVQYKHQRDQDFLANYGKKENLGEAFIAKYERYTDYFWADKLLRYYIGQRRRDSSFRGPEGFLSMLDEIEINNPAALNDYTYAFFLEDYVGYDLQEYYDWIQQEERDPNEVSQMIWDDAKRKLTGEALAFNLAWQLKGWMESNYAVDFYGPKLEAYKQQFPESPYLELLEKTDEEIAILNPGKAAPDFQLKDFDGKEVSLSDFAGKIVYIDFWYANCGPCLVDFQDTEEMKAELPQDEIAFVYVNIGDNRNTAQPVIDKYGLTGTHLRTDWKSELLQNYQVRACPHYVILDREGKIISPKAKRPAFGAKEALLDVVEKF